MIHCLQKRVTSASKPLQGMLKGFIDLVFEHQGRYYVLDWKSNHLRRQCQPLYHGEALKSRLWRITVMISNIRSMRSHCTAFLRSRVADYEL